MRLARLQTGPYVRLRGRLIRNLDTEIWNLFGIWDCYFQKRKSLETVAGNNAMNEKKILIVEDDELIRQVFEEALSNAGYVVRAVESAEKALGILKQEDIRVMFLDMKLPGMNGIELCKAIKQEKPFSIVYAVTGYVSVFELSNCLENGFDDYFTKPVDLQVLYKAAQSAFEKIDKLQ